MGKHKWIKQAGVRLIEVEDGTFRCVKAYECEKCGCELYTESRNVPVQCPNCGARMDGEVVEE